ncbi:hypothetical protein EIP91_005996 [Steccherinum ochraceum]|uniref:Uncharacterized protein n=1 Tax=Steccherinum ochraceum TaxID=92696 RepID=A0A4R0RLD7_9APHY|nr:hypothetical protein EIP91_005996 [Steccherinum ochraceum]
MFTSSHSVASETQPSQTGIIALGLFYGGFSGHSWKLHAQRGKYRSGEPFIRFGSEVSNSFRPANSYVVFDARFQDTARLRPEEVSTMRFTSDVLVAAVAFFGILSSTHAWQTSFQLTGKTLVLGNVSYFVPPTPVSQLNISGDAKTLSSLSTTANDFAGEIIPITVIPTSNTSFGQAQFQSTVDSYKASDDVFSESFLAGVYILFTGQGKPTASVSFASQAFNTSLVLMSPQYSGGIALTKPLPAGPYFVSPGSGEIFQALRLYEDEQQSFIYGTAPAVQRLLDGGMVLVGKTKSSQFANGEQATEDWVDQHAPYNPRGDGYQDGSASSTGSATALAAYPWLDHSIGSDTGGSMRDPASVNGLFGLRPSLDAVSLDDVMPLSPVFDTGGVFARDAKAWAKVGHWWYQNLSDFTQFPKKIWFPLDSFGGSFLNGTTPAPGSSDAIFNDFVTKLEGFLGVNRTTFNFLDSWNTTKPANSTAPSIGVLLNTAYADIATPDQVALVADPFINAFKAEHSGRAPFISPSPLIHWAFGRGVTPAQRVEAIQNKTIFLNWFAQNIVKPDNTTCSDSIFLYPHSVGATNYRNQYGSPPVPPLGFSLERIAVHAETPDFVVPVGEVAYNSTVTNTTEFLPVTLSVVASKNCDLMLFNMFSALQDAGILNPVMTGARMFSAEPV